MFHLLFRRAFFGILLCGVFLAHAAPPLEVGTYIREGNSGTLILKKDMQGNLTSHWIPLVVTRISVASKEKFGMEKL